MQIIINVQLRHVEPKVIRRLSVPAQMSFYQLHLALQAAFGWENYHLFSFNEGRMAYSNNIITNTEVEGMEGRDAKKLTLDKVIKSTSDRLTYLYDFGDDWEHDITILDINDQIALHFELLEAEGLCPAEDSRGDIIQGKKRRFKLRKNEITKLKDNVRHHYRLDQSNIANDLKHKRKEYSDREMSILHKMDEFCKTSLNEAYFDLCRIVLDDLLDLNEKAVSRGDIDIWASAIIWSVGSNNFLGDSSFEPYATLNDVCNYFNTKSSTIGNKAGAIRKKLDINHFEHRYLLADSPVLGLMNRIKIDANGFMFMEDEDIDEDENNLESTFTIDRAREYLFFMIIELPSSFKLSDKYQMEYLIDQSVKALKIKGGAVKTFFDDELEISVVAKPDLIDSLLERLDAQSLAIRDVRIVE